MLRVIRAWFLRQNVTMRAALAGGMLAIVGAVLAGLLGVGGNLALQFLARERPVLVGVVSGRVGPFAMPICSLSPAGMAKLKACKEVITIDVPNESSTPMLNTVFLFEKSGLVEVTDGERVFEFREFNNRVEIPLIPPLEKRRVRIWHDKPTVAGDKMTMTTWGSEKMVSYARNYDDQGFAVVCIRTQWIAWGVPAVLALLFAPWAYRRLRRTPRPSPVATTGP